MTSIQREFFPEILHICKNLTVLGNLKDVSSGGCFCVLFYLSRQWITHDYYKCAWYDPNQVWHDPWPWDMTHTSVWHDSYISVTWLIRKCDMTHTAMWHDSYISVTCLVCTCDMTHAHKWHDSIVCGTLFYTHTHTHTHTYFYISAYIHTFIYIPEYTLEYTKVAWLVPLTSGCLLSTYDTTLWHDPMTRTIPRVTRLIHLLWQTFQYSFLHTHTFIIHELLYFHSLSHTRAPIQTHPTTHTPTYTHTHPHANTLTHPLHTHTPPHICMPLARNSYIYIHICIFIYICIHRYTEIYIEMHKSDIFQPRNGSRW